MSTASLARIRSAPGPHPIRALAAAPLVEDEFKWLDNVRQFLTGWLAGLVFFGTFLA